MNIEQWGWKTYLESHPEQAGVDPSCVGRVIEQHRDLSRAVSGHGESWCRTATSLREQASSRSQLPTVGDWVLLEMPEQHAEWIVSAVLPRTGAFTRNAAGREIEQQVIASNIDTVFLVSGLDGGRNFNLRSIERYLTAAWESGAEPVIVLNKADLCTDVGNAVAQAESVAMGVPVHTLSCRTGDGVETIRRYALPGSTIALIGLSGVGKSSIINLLAGEPLTDIGEQRESDRRGKHTTTSRELILLPDGALLLDTPGLRELQLWADESALSSAFPDIEGLSTECRFRDCAHNGEPGCAVQEALSAGALAAERFESYIRLQSEIRYLKSKNDREEQKKTQSRGKSIAKHARRLKKHRKGYGGPP